MTQPIYIDHAAATPVDPTVLKAMRPFWQKAFYNPSATYLAARAVNQALQEARRQAAACLGARPAEIIFTAGGTEANNLAIDGIMRHHPKANLVVGAVEHKSVLETAAQYPCRIAPVNAAAVVDIEKLKGRIDDRTVLVSVMYANNEVGSIQPLRQIHRLLETIRQERLRAGNKLPLYFHTDASQAPNYLPMQVSRLGVDMMTVNGGKIYGPKQTGLLFVKTGVELLPLVRGGGQERGLRSGTENVAGFVGLAAALQLAQTLHQTEASRLGKLQALFETELHKIAPKAVFNSRGHRLPNFVHVTFPGVDNERLMMQLDEQGIMCAAGSACQASTEEPSHVLTAMGLTTAQAQSSLRFSLGRGTTKQAVTTTVKALAKLLNSAV